MASRQVKDMGGQGVLKPSPKKPFRMKGVGSDLRQERLAKERAAKKEKERMAAAEKRYNQRKQKERGTQGPPQPKPQTKVTAPKAESPTVKMDVTPPKPKPKVTPKPVPRVYARAPGVGSRIKTALLGKDQKFGGDRGLIDFLPGKSRKKKSTAKPAAKSGTSKTATTSKATVTGKDKKDGSVRRNVGKGEALRANVTKEQLDRLGLKGKSGLTTYLNFMDKNNRRPTKSDNLGGLTLNKNMGGMAMKPKGMRRGGRVMSEPAMPTPPSRRRRGTPTPALNPNLTAADQKLRAALRGKATPSAAPSLGDIVRKGGKIPTKTPTPNVDGATRRRGKTPNTPPMPKLPGGMKGGGMAKKGYAKGGPVRSKMSAKGGKRGGASRKPRGVGVATRGYGKALK